VVEPSIVKAEKKTGQRYNYYCLCESYRIGNKVRHRSIVGMGKLNGKETKDDKKCLQIPLKLKFVEKVNFHGLR